MVFRVLSLVPGLSGLMGPPRRAIAETLYGAIVVQARDPHFFAAWGVADSMDGRFEMVTIHVALTFQRLRAGEPRERRLGSELLEVFFDDMDASLREQGVGDTRIPKKVRALGEAFYGRLTAYDAAMASGTDALAETVARNVFEKSLPDAAAAKDLARYMVVLAAALAAQPADALTSGAIEFCSVAGGTDDERVS